MSWFCSLLFGVPGMLTQRFCRFTSCLGSRPIPRYADSAPRLIRDVFAGVFQDLGRSPGIARTTTAGGDASSGGLAAAAVPVPEPLYITTPYYAFSPPPALVSWQPDSPPLLCDVASGTVAMARAPSSPWQQHAASLSGTSSPWKHEQESSPEQLSAVNAASLCRLYSSRTWRLSGPELPPPPLRGISVPKVIKNRH